MPHLQGLHLGSQVGGQALEQLLVGEGEGLRLMLPQGFPLEAQAGQSPPPALGPEPKGVA